MYRFTFNPYKNAATTIVLTALVISNATFRYLFKTKALLITYLILFLI